MIGVKNADADKIREILHQTACADRLGESAAPHLGPVYSMKGRTIFNHPEMHAILVERYGIKCRGCMFDGSIHGERGRLYLELDHVEPKSAGGHDDLDNKALLCGPCNRAKGGRRTLIALRREAMGRSERRHSINLRVAGEWCRERLREERVRNPELGV